MTTRSIRKAIFTALSLSFGALGLATFGAGSAPAGDGGTSEFCYDYNCPRPHFSVLRKAAGTASAGERYRSTRPAAPHDQTSRSNGKQVGENCCVIIGIDRHRSVVMGQDRASGRKFQFVVRNRRLLGALRPGQTVSVNFTDMEVLMSPPCGDKACQIVLIARSSPNLATQE